jgi:hypothetical protein
VCIQLKMQSAFLLLYNTHQQYTYSVVYVYVQQQFVVWMQLMSCYGREPQYRLVPKQSTGSVILLIVLTPPKVVDPHLQ